MYRELQAEVHPLRLLQRAADGLAELDVDQLALAHVTGEPGLALARGTGRQRTTHPRPDSGHALAVWRGAVGRTQRLHQTHIQWRPLTPSHEGPSQPSPPADERKRPRTCTLAATDTRSVSVYAACSCR